MLNVLIADDNRLIRQSLRKRIDWDALGMQCIGEAENGRQTLDMIAQYKPDIVIMDIRMPYLDGLQVMQSARERNLPIQFILISGYDDFAYLKQAIRLQAVNYLLKPIHTPELIESLQLAAKRCSATHTAPAAAAIEPHAVRRPALSQLRQLGLAADTPLPGYVFCVGINLPDANVHITPFTQAAIEQIVQAGYALFLPFTCNAHLCSRETLVLIIGQSHARPPSGYLLDRLMQTVREMAGCSNAFFACSDTKESNFISSLLHQALFRLLARFSETEKRGAAVASNHSSAMQRKLRKQLEDLVQLQLYEACCTAIRQAFAAAQAAGWYADCLVTVLRFWRDFLLDCGSAAPFPAGEPEVFALQFPDAATLENTVLHSIANHAASETQHPTYDKILSYINRFYAEPLSLQHLSQVFHLNQAYLGQLIKKSSGLSFHTLLNEIRLEKAIQILQENRAISIKDLAVSLGFSDAYYFTRVFKQRFGVAPSEYRRSLQAPQ